MYKNQLTAHTHTQFIFVENNNNLTTTKSKFSSHKIKFEHDEKSLIKQLSQKKAKKKRKKNEIVSRKKKKREVDKRTTHIIGL